MKDKQAECPESPTGRHISLVHNEHNGEGEEVCYYCGRVKKAITEFELYLGIPIDPYARGYWKEARISKGRRKGRHKGRRSQKSQFYLDNIEKIKADWHKGGRDLVLKNWPIAFSTLRQKERVWGLVPDTDRRKNRFLYRPSGKQMILV